MKCYKVLDPAFGLTKQKIDVYETDEKYWQSMWHKPVAGKE
jgi:hypothetical protein